MNENEQADIAATIRAVIAAKMDLKLENVKDDADLVKDIGFDSLDTVELVMEVETALGIEIDESAAASVKTVGDMIKLATKIVGAK